MTSITARETVTDELHDMFTFLLDEAQAEAENEDINIDRLEKLIRASSQAAVNYRYHANLAD